MTETVTTCLLCGASDSRPFDERVFRGLRVTNRICCSCGFVFQSPRMTESESREFYAAEYRRLYQGSEGPTNKDRSVQTERARLLLAFTQASMGAPTSGNEDALFLDIGCSTGKLMEGFAHAYGWRVAGVEPGDAYRRELQNRGLDAYATLEGFEQSGQYPCTLISMIHVLEHLPYPIPYLAYLRQKLLQPAGWLLLEVPNLYCHDCFEVAHLTSFSAHTLAQTLQQAGFKIVALKKHGAPRSILLPLYITLLARPVHAPPGADTRVAPSNVVPEHSVMLKRRIGMLRRRIVTRLSPSLAWIPTP
jgi:2-polyprenyl-3-methyl-5-hydroxy-6-metoxy-1,4-benzoquinol methylase